MNENASQASALGAAARRGGATARPGPRWLAPLVDYGPLTVFALVYALADILSATAAMVAMTAIGIALSLALTRRVPIASLIVAVMVIAFGAITLWLDDPAYLKIQSTLTNLLFGVVLLVASLFRVSLIKLVFADALTLSEAGWALLTRRFMIFFFVMAALNETIARTQSESVWAWYYSFGSTVLGFAFIAAQYPLLSREAEAAEREA